MFNTKRLVVLCDIDSTQSADNGDRVRIVTNAIKTIGEKTIAGVNTQTLAQLQNMSFSYSIIVDKMYYSDQKYLFVDDKVYKIQSVTPAKLNKDCKLNVVEFSDANIENAIKEWLFNDIQ